MSRLRVYATLVLVAIAVLIAGPQGAAWAQGSDAWSWVITPQVWLTHIEDNGFVSPSSFGAAVVPTVPSGFVRNPFTGENSEPVETIYPQWGVQVAAQRGRWTLAGSVQYVSFETRTDVIYSPRNNRPTFAPLPTIPISFVLLNPGERVAQEFVDTTRIDIDVAASYVFPDVIRDRLDLSVGGGVKVIFAEATRQYGNLHLWGAAFAALEPPGTYLICKEDDCSDAAFRDRVKARDVIYGGTIPLNATIRLTQDARWLLPISVTPFLGAETRDDRDVVYRIKRAPESATGIKVDRQDGTTFAYGVTGDLTLRYLLSEAVSIYAGGRVQYINGHEDYLAYGPIVGLSVRLGGR